MQFPTIKLSNDLLIDQGPNATPLTWIGQGQIAMVNESLLSPIPQFEFQEALLAKTVQSMAHTTKLTVEAVVQPTVTLNGNTLFSNESYFDTVGQFSISLTNSRFIIYRNVGYSYAHYECSVPIEYRNKLAHYAVVLDFPTWKFYVEGQQIGQIDMNYPIAEDRLVLFGSVKDDNSINTFFRGRFSSMRVCAGIALTAEEFYIPQMKKERTEALSLLPVTDLTLSSVDGTVVSEIINTDQLFQVSKTNGDFIRVLKETGSVEGAYLTGIGYDQSNNLLVYLSDQTTINAGLVPINSQGNGIRPDGVGYLYDDGLPRYIQIEGLNSVLFSETENQFTLSLEASTTPPLTHDTRISLYEPHYSSSTKSIATTANVWYEKDISELRVVGMTLPTMSAQNRVIMPAGNYYVDGVVALSMFGSMGARLVNAIDNTVLLKSEVAYTATSVHFDRRVVIRGLITLFDDTEIKLEYASTVNTGAVGIATTAIKARQLTTEIHFYRTA